MNIEPVIFEGRYVRLEPLSLDHYERLCEVGLDADLWRWTATLIRTPDEMRGYIQTALDWHAAGTALPFATIERSSGRVVGSTRLAAYDHENHTIEIGWTWIARPWQRTPINTEAKYLMLGHAFESLHCMRVALKTDSLNERSRNAIRRIGAKEEGTLRNHMLTHTGRKRHTVYFSVIDSEWPEVKSSLEARLSRPFAPR
jgi:RimJ/RimL family protein N-acetyltransferase